MGAAMSERASESSALGERASESSELGERASESSALSERAGESSELLRSYVSGGWHTATDEGRPLHDAVTGAQIARISSTGLDFAGALEYGRRIGGPALRELTFHQRAALLKALGLHLKEHRAELYEVSARTGSTRGDSMFDVDGGVGVLLAYASKGRRELPNDTVYTDGALEPLGRGGTFLGQHICTSRHGVAVQINAFNFPVWGPLEKLAPAFLAGVPSLIKPASPTAFLTAKLVELIVSSGLLPEGSLQFVAGGVGDLFDHLTEQDSVAFTGSAATAARLRTHPVLIGRSVRFTAEADSLNLSILGPDATPGTTGFDLYVKGLVAEMTVKAGQKCTAIRRAFVPAQHLDAVVEAVSARLARITIGNPGAEGVRMGALASLEQRAEVRRGVKALADAGRIVFGDPDSVEVIDADAERGAFVSPILLVADPDRAEPHEVEAFGPVSTVLPFTSTEQVIELAARGQGSLAGSIVTADPAFAREVVLGVAPWHGRLLVLNDSDAKESTGHGSPLPALVHGGPGRAGGGEELGGIRGVLHHMQRTAIQADPDTLTAITGRWVPGSRRTETDVHPFRKHLEELRPGDTIVAGPRRVTKEDVEHFAEFTGDTFYAHMDAAAAAANPLFGERVAHGYLVVSFAAGLFVDPDPGPVLANFGVDNLRFLTPVRFGDELTVTLTCKQLTPRDTAGYGEVRWDADVTRQDGESVARYDVLTLVAKRDDPDGGRR
jgi:oxepin-CoA hydrolase / 3-oxo-5,6-dehydrosuberyl-CoA semialdehyde dehydrogenase